MNLFNIIGSIIFTVFEVSMSAILVILFKVKNSIVNLLLRELNISFLHMLSNLFFDDFQVFYLNCLKFLPKAIDKVINNLLNIVVSYSF